MAETSGIAWTKSTFNSHIGCTKIGPGCDNCYAEVLDKRHKWGGATHWGAGVPRYRTSESNWRKPLTWNKQAPESEFAGRKGFWPVFCASLGDVFDNDVPQEWRNDLWKLIVQTPNLSWLLVTKRIGNVISMIPTTWLMSGFPENIRLMITVVNQEEADRDVPKLLALPVKNGISYEPALGPVNWLPWLEPFNDLDATMKPTPRLQWIIVGGESSQPGHPARPFDMKWARNTVDQCQAAGVPVFVKQLGSVVRGPTMTDNYNDPVTESFRIGYMPNGQRAPFGPIYKDRAGADPAEWPEDLRVREFPL